MGNSELKTCHYTDHLREAYQSIILTQRAQTLDYSEVLPMIDSCIYFGTCKPVYVNGSNNLPGSIYVPLDHDARNSGVSKRDQSSNDMVT